MYDTIVLSGGGIKGYIYIGVLEKLEKNDILKHIKNYSGTSIGALFCFLICLGYTSNELKNIFINMDLQEIIKFDIKNLLNDGWGLCNRKNIIVLIDFFLKTKGYDQDITFRNFYNNTNKNFSCIATNVNNFKETFFSVNTFPDIKIKDAILASMNIPILFSKFQIYNDYYIDGGFTNNFPINYYNSEKTIGFYLSSPKSVFMQKNINVNENMTFFDYIKKIFKGIHIEFSDIKHKIFVESKNNKCKIVTFDMSDYSTTEFNISNEKKLELIKLGMSFTFEI